MGKREKKDEKMKTFTILRIHVGMTSYNMNLPIFCKEREKRQKFIVVSRSSLSNQFPYHYFQFNFPPTLSHS